jgi:soluble lytic murein transglycosylase-like protein
MLKRIGLIAAAFPFSAFLLLVPSAKTEAPRLPDWLRPRTVVVSTAVQDAEIEVARVFGRIPACAESPDPLIRDVAEAAITHQVDPRVYASLVGTESGCSQFAVSSRGAIGYSQIMPRIWKDRYDITGRYNLFNQQDNLDIGASIVGDQIHAHGLADGLRRYNGLGVGCDTCDGGYADRIMALAGRKQ